MHQHAHPGVLPCLCFGGPTGGKLGHASIPFVWGHVPHAQRCQDPQRLRIAAPCSESRTFGKEGNLPGLKLSRQVSWGRKAAPAAGISAPPRSKWQDAVSELAKLPGGRVLPLVKVRGRRCLPPSNCTIAVCCVASAWRCSLITMLANQLGSNL